MEPFMPVECLRKKVIPSKVLPFSRKDRFCTICLFTSARLPLERKRQNLPVFCTWYGSSPGAKRKKTLPFKGKFLPKFSYK